MKKLYAFLILIGVTASASAQVEIRDYTGTGGTQVGDDISGTTFTVTVDHGGTVLQHFAVKNVSGADEYLRIKRLRIDVPGDWADSFSWGQDPDDYLEGNCFSPAIMNSNPWTSPNTIGTDHAQTIEDQNIGDLNIDFTVGAVGSGHYRYYIMPNDGDVAIDSIDVIVERTLSVSTEQKEELGMTAYPNPANNYLTVNTTGTNGDVTLRITDVLGKVVYNDQVGGLKKLDVSEFKNGVYLISVYDRGNLIRTRRVVVRH